MPRVNTEWYSSAPCQNLAFDNLRWTCSEVPTLASHKYKVEPPFMISSTTTQNPWVQRPVCAPVRAQYLYQTHDLPRDTHWKLQVARKRYQSKVA